MQHPETLHKKRGITFWVLTSVLPAIAFILALFALILWYSETREESDLPSLTSENEFNEQANFVLERANDAVNSAELILSFLEAASVIITISIAVAAIFGLSSINELRAALDETEEELLKRVETAEARLIERERQLANMEDLLAEAEKRIDKAIEERLQQVYKETEMARRQSAALRQYALAEQLLGERNVDAALEACREAYALDPENYANNYLYGTILIEKAQYESAIRHLEEALTVEPDFAPAVAALGLATRRAGDLVEDRQHRNELYNSAEARLIQALQMNANLLTNDGESYYGTLGSLYRRQDRILDALDSYRLSAEITPRRSYPFVNLAMLYLKQGEEQLRDQNLIIAERNAARRLADKSTDYWALYDLALIHLIRGDVDTAARHFKEATEVTPPALSIYYSVIARLVFLQSIDGKMPGLSQSIDLLDTQVKRLSRL